MSLIKTKYKKIVILLIIFSILLNMVLVPLISHASGPYIQDVKTGIDLFPSSYQVYLRKLKEQHPNWSFDAYYTGISWRELLENETDHGHNRIIRTADELYKCSCGDVASGYACASSGIIAYYLDPRNFLDDVSVFQFLEISYNPNVHNLAGVQKSVKNTFLDNTVTFTLNGEKKTMSYPEIIIEAAKQSNMSPYTIRTKIIQEVGTQGSSSVSGTYEGYEGYYNFYNYGAYDSGNAIANGLRYAKDAGWDNQYTAIVEGAKLLASAYTNAGQNTAYFYKWDVVGNSILTSGNRQTLDTNRYFFRHQYMTNVQDPKSQSKTLFNLYASSGILEENLNFIIPVYDFMPESQVPLPSDLNTNSDPNILIYYVSDSDGINVRSAPGTSSSRVCSIPKDTQMIVLEKDAGTASGYVWYKIQLSNGIVGYVARDYIAYYSGNDADPNQQNNNTNTEEPTNNTNTEQPVENQNNNNTQTNVTDNLDLKVDEEKSIIIVTPNVTAEFVINKMQIKNYTLTDSKDQKVEKTAQVGTGYKFTNKDNKKTYTIVKLGDANGDGKINSGDLFTIQKYLLKRMEFSNIQIKASDANKDGKVNSGDLFTIQKHLLKKGEINI